MRTFDHIDELVNAHECSDEEERKGLGKLRSLLAGAANPFDRNNFSPGHVTCSVLATSSDKTAVALIFHQRLRRWLQPGGHAEAGEILPRAVAARELQEETGTEISRDALRLLDIDVHRIPEGRDPEHLHFDLRFIIAVPREGLKAGTDAARAEWVEIGKLENYEIDEGIARMVRKARAAGYLGERE